MNVELSLVRIWAEYGNTVLGGRVDVMSATPILGHLGLILLAPNHDPSVSRRFSLPLLYMSLGFLCFQCNTLFCCFQKLVRYPSTRTLYRILVAYGQSPLRLAFYIYVSLEPLHRTLVSLPCLVYVFHFMFGRHSQGSTRI